jgi:hypothetical protein
MTDTQRQSPQNQANPADLLGPKEILEVQEQGRQAFHAGQPVTVCPWAAAQNPANMFRRQMWVRGYAQGRTELRQTRDQVEPE